MQILTDVGRKKTTRHKRGNSSSSSSSSSFFFEFPIHFRWARRFGWRYSTVSLLFIDSVWLVVPSGLLKDPNGIAHKDRDPSRIHGALLTISAPNAAAIGFQVHWRRGRRGRRRCRRRRYVIDNNKSGDNISAIIDTIFHVQLLFDINFDRGCLQQVWIFPTSTWISVAAEPAPNRHFEPLKRWTNLFESGPKWTALITTDVGFNDWPQLTCRFWSSPRRRCLGGR